MRALTIPEKHLLARLLEIEVQLQMALHPLENGPLRDTLWKQAIALTTASKRYQRDIQNEEPLT